MVRRTKNCKQVSFDMPTVLYNRIYDLAASRRVPRKAVIVEALEDYLPKAEKQWAEEMKALGPPVDH